MAGYSYAGLEVRVTADTRGMAGDIRSAATSAGQDAAKSISQSMTGGLKAIGGLLGSVGKAATAGLGAASAAAIGFGVSAFHTAARAGEMDASLQALAKTNNLNIDSLRKSVGAVKDQGIEMGVAQGLVAQFVRSNLDLAKATDLARVAQDAAVISGRNSTEVLDDLVHGITTQNTMVLRNAGIQVNATKAQDDYAKTLGKTRAELTEAEKAQATLNAVLKEGGKVAGAYEAAMTEPGKVLRSFKRVIDDIKLSVGEGLLQAFGPLILQTYDLAKAFSKAVEPGGVLSPIFTAIADAVGSLVAPVTNLVGQWAKMLAGLKPDQVARVVDIIKQFGPALVIAGAALAAFTGAGVLGQLPIIGGLLSTLLGPLKLLGPTLLAVGKAAAGVVGPMLGIKAGAVGMTAALGPVGLIVAGVVAALALLAATSAKFRAALVDVGKAVLSAVMPAVSALVGGVKQLLPPILDVARALGDALGPILTRLAPLLQPIGALVGGVLVVAFGALAVALRVFATVLVASLQILGRLVELIPVEPIRSFSSAVSGAISAAAAFLNPLRLLSGVLDALSRAVSAVVRWIFGGSPGLIPAFSAAASAAGALGGPLRALIGVFSAVAGAVRSLVSTVTSGFNAVKSAVSSSMSAAASATSAAFASIRSAATSGASAVLSAVSSAFGQVRGVVQSAMSAIPGIVSSALASAVGAARSGGAAIMNGLQAGINSAAGAVMSTISSVAGKVAGALSSALKIGSPSKLTIPMGRDLVLGLGVGWDRQIDETLAGMTADLHGPHVASPLLAGGTLAGIGPAGAGATINVYPSAGMDERQLAAMVSRELAWATAGGT